MSRATDSPIAVASMETLDMSGDSMEEFASFDDPDMTLLDGPVLVEPPPVQYLTLQYNPGHFPGNWESCIVTSPKKPFHLTNIQALARKGIACAISDDRLALDFMPLPGTEIDPEQIRLNVQNLLDKALEKMPGIIVTVFLEQDF